MPAPGPIGRAPGVRPAVKERQQPRLRITFLLQGNALANLYEDGLMVRVGPDRMDEALARPGTGQLVFRGKEQR